MNWQILKHEYGHFGFNEVVQLVNNTCHHFEIAFDPFFGVCIGFRPHKENAFENFMFEMKRDLYAISNATMDRNAKNVSKSNLK